MDHGITILLCTSTILTGVNLVAHNVILIKRSGIHAFYLELK